jgi:hypothetical protein
VEQSGTNGARRDRNNRQIEMLVAVVATITIAARLVLLFVSQSSAFSAASAFGKVALGLTMQDFPRALKT